MDHVSYKWTNLLAKLGAYLSPGSRRVFVELVREQFHHVIDIPLCVLA